MGYNITQLKNGKYKMKSTISDESYHPDNKSVTQDEAKVILINEKFWGFIEDVIKIEMEFPNGYFVNGQRVNSNHDFYNWKSSVLDGDATSFEYRKKFQEVYDRLKLEFSI